MKTMEFLSELQIRKPKSVKLSCFSTLEKKAFNFKFLALGPSTVCSGQVGNFQISFQSWDPNRLCDVFLGVSKIQHD